MAKQLGFNVPAAPAPAPRPAQKSLAERAREQMARQEAIHNRQPIPSGVNGPAESIKRALMAEYQKFLAEMEAENAELEAEEKEAEVKSDPIEVKLDEKTVDEAVDAFVAEDEKSAVNGISVGEEFGDTVVVKPKRTTRKKASVAVDGTETA